MKKLSFKKMMAALLAAGMALGVVSCGNSGEEAKESSSEVMSQESGTNQGAVGSDEEESLITFPLAEEMSFDIMVKDVVDMEENLEKCEWWQELYERTNVKINFIPLASDDPMTALNGMFTAGKEGDAIFSAFISDTNLNLLYASGMLLPLDEYIVEDIMPNFFERVLSESPQTLGSITSPDGHIFALPKYDANMENYLERKLFIEPDWLEASGYETPTTLEELEKILIYFRDHDMNGNGDPDDEIPFMLYASNNYASVEAFLQFFGIATKSNELDSFVYVENGEVKFAPTSQNYKNALTLLNRWYEEGLVWPECFTGTKETFASKMSSKEHVVGVVPMNEMKDWGYELIIPPKAEGYENSWFVHPGIYGVKGAFCLTRSCENAEILMRWIDLFYSLEGTMGYRGLEGVIHTLREDGVYQDLKVENLADALAAVADERTRMMACFGNINLPTALTREDYTSGIYVDPDGKLYESEYYNKYKEAGVLNEEPWPRPYMMEDDLNRLNELRTDLFNTINEKKASWVCGNSDIESEWDSYVEDLEKMGVDEYVQMLQEAYDTYIEGMN